MKKPLAPKAPRVSVTAPKKTGLLRKAARVGATVVATRVAADTGKKGVFGLLAGLGVAHRADHGHYLGAVSA